MDTHQPGGEREQALRALEAVVDPEVCENIVDLGLVERLVIDADTVVLTLVLTSPSCPMGDAIADDAFRALQRALPERDIQVLLAQDLSWDPQRMSAGARKRLGWGDAAG